MVFLVLDYFLGINVRLASLDTLPGWRALYYLVCFACLSGMLWRPQWAAVISTAESLVTLAMLLITMGARVMNYAAVLDTPESGLVSAEEIANFVIAGGIAWLAYQRGLNSIRRQLK